MTTERIDVVVSERGSRRVRRNIEDIGDGANKAQGAVQLLQRALAALGGALAIRQLQRLLDTYTNIQNRLRTVTDGTAELTVATERLFEISRRTRTSFAGTAETFARVGLAAKELGVSQNELLGFTESLNQAVVLSGASADEAQAGLIQLSQGLASGALRGDELRAVLEQLPVVADIIAKELGVTRGELRDLGAEGAITADIVLRAFKNAREELQDRFGETIPTISQSFQVLYDQVLQVVGGIDTSLGVSAKLAQLLLLVADNAETLVRGIGALATTIGILLAQRAIPAAIGALRALTAAIAANPIGAIAVALSATVSTLIFWSDQIRIAGTEVANLQDLALAAWRKIKEGLSALVDFFTPAFNYIAELADGSFHDIDVSARSVLEGGAFLVDKYIGLWIGAFKAIVNGWSQLPAAFEDIFKQALNGAISLVERGVNEITAALDAVLGYVGAGQIGAVSLGRVGNDAAGSARKLGETVGNAFSEGFEFSGAQDLVKDVLKDADEIGRERLKREKERQEELAQARKALGESGPGVAQGGGGGDESDGPTFGGILAQLKEEAELLKQTARQREINAEILRIEDQLKRDLTETERGLLREQLEQNRQLKERANLLEEIKGPEQELERRQANLTALFEQGKISLQEYTEEMRRLRVEMTSQDNSLFGGVENGLARLAERSNDFGKNVSNVVVGAFDEAGNAVAEFAKTGKFNFKDFASSIQDQLLKLATNQLFSQLAGLALGAFGGGFGGGIGLGLGLGGAGSQGLTGFAEGGTFDVNRQNAIGTTSGRDNRVVAFRANDTEEVEVRKKGSGGKGAGGTTKNYINFNISTPDADSFRRSQSQIFADAQAAMSRAGRRNG